MHYFSLAKVSWCEMYENGSLMMLRSMNACLKWFSKSGKGFLATNGLQWKDFYNIFDGTGTNFFAVLHNSTRRAGVIIIENVISSTIQELLTISLRKTWLTQLYFTKKNLRSSLSWNYSKLEDFEYSGFNKNSVLK